MTARTDGRLRRVEPLHRAALAGAGATAALLISVVAGVLAEGLPALAVAWWDGRLTPWWPYLANTVIMTCGAGAVSAGLGVGVGALRVEYLIDPQARRALDLLITLLTSLPTVILGLVAFDLLIAQAGWPFSTGAGAVTLAALNLPWMAAGAREAFLGVPDSLRAGSLALGATRFQTFVRVVLPAALPALTGAVGMGVARLLGEVAALIYTAGLVAPARPGLDWRQPGGSLAVEVWHLRTEGVSPAAPREAAMLASLLLLLVAAVLWGFARLARGTARR
ncbi:Phosphate transport system permease protein PstA (TC 3.A.1.7.1) [Candidatus Hydrogenisulfobacillus filiaventi]|uniref:Phosphate transport system permease protein PstA (TC 3.A.1.7.1) n=1 Tax=Candidatus Hydrogenisulfobacillus filiaventi TaxID=2707344 RepID=A0A6F8ZJ17_9FIRM|nr:ABC transporter permease subunit [Bacillota bacterium]CAB1129725.1 Phosphate transport system permease protein PstA (TC 3.A.1.7.1) [Candidatus Hydrogenisulfobacillus filiaventi]